MRTLKVMCIALALTGLSVNPATGAPGGHASALTRPQRLAPDFRANYPETAAGRTDGELLELAEQTCADITAGMFWPELLARVQTRYGVDSVLGSGILSLIGSFCPAGIRQH